MILIKNWLQKVELKCIHYPTYATQRFKTQNKNKNNKLTINNALKSVMGLSIRRTLSPPPPPPPPLNAYVDVDTHKH